MVPGLVPEVLASAFVSALLVFDLDDDEDSPCFVEEEFLPFSAISAALVDARSVSISICGASPFVVALFCLRINFA